MQRVTRVAAVVLLTLGLAHSAMAQGFGRTMAVSGSEIIIGENGNSAFNGSIYVFEKGDDGMWAESYQMEGPDGGMAGDGYGQALTANESHMVVGAPSSNMAYLYARQADGSWAMEASLMADDAAEGDRFGSNAVLGDGFVAVTAGSQGENAGAVYVFRGGEAGWTQEAKLAPDSEGGDFFGSAMMAHGDMLYVGAPSRNSPFGRGEFTEVGAVYLYSYADGAWTDAGQIGPQGVAEGGGFGYALAMHGDKVAVGAPFDNNVTGSVSLFSWDEDSKSYAASGMLAPFVSGRFIQFGAFVTIDDEGVFIGAPGDGARKGATYWYGYGEDGSFGTGYRSSAAAVSGRAGFGATFAGAGEVAVIGATAQDGGSGAAVVYEMSDMGWTEINMVVNKIKGFPSITEGKVECEDSSVAGFECSNVDIESFLSLDDLGAPRGSMVNDIWGWTDGETDKEYAIVGRNNGTSFVDVTNPAAPIYLGDLPMTPGSRAAAWRDMKVYQDHVYIVADGAGQHGMQVFDLARLRDLDGGDPPIMEPDFLYTDIASAHNIVINEETGYAYSVGGSSGGVTCGGGLHMLDLTDPKNPSFAGCFADPATGRAGTGYSHDAQCVTYAGPDTEHAGKEICMGSNETALSIADVSDKDNPVAISSVVYPNVAYAHQGWLSEDHEYFYMNDEGDEPQQLVDGTRTLVWDVRDLDEPVLVTEYIATTTTTDHNLYIKDNLMYQSNYGSGLRILDITDRANPVEVGFLDTTPFGGGGSWSNYPYFNSGAIAVTSMGEGLFMVRHKDQEM